MQFSNIFLSLVLATAVVAKGGKDNPTTKTVTDKSLCKDMISFSKLIKLASNETRLQQKANNNATEIAFIKAKAVQAQTQLAAMETNVTLTSTCAAIASAEETEDICNDIKKLTKRIARAANTTVLSEKARGNTTKENSIKAKAFDARIELDALMENTTLISVCTNITATKAAKKAEKAARKAVEQTATLNVKRNSKNTIIILSTKNTAMVLNAKSGFLSIVMLVAAGLMAL